MVENIENAFITNLYIDHVRHLKNLKIPFREGVDTTNAEKGRSHLLVTGKNGSGKTSVLDALAAYLNDICGRDQLRQYKSILEGQKRLLNNFGAESEKTDDYYKIRERISEYYEKVTQADSGLRASFSCNVAFLKEQYKQGNFILAYFKANRVFEAAVSNHIEKVILKEQYSIIEDPKKDFIKYLVDKKVSQSLFQNKNEIEKADKLNKWFMNFENLLRDIFQDQNLELDFDVETFKFYILEKGRERFDFNTMSSGYAAILDIVVGIIMRMEKHTDGVFRFDMPGIVLIDEIETHLHYELQKKILPFLCTVFPNIQFIVSTHSAFILSSIGNAVIYDLENKVLVQDGLTDVPYEGIIAGYFNVKTLSKELQDKFEKYKILVAKNTLSDDELAEIQRLELYLDEIPDYLGLDIATEYKQLKLEFEAREDI